MQTKAWLLPLTLYPAFFQTFFYDDKPTCALNSVSIYSKCNFFSVAMKKAYPLYYEYLL